MKFFIDLSDERNLTVEELLNQKGESVFEFNAKTTSKASAKDVYIFSPAKKFLKEDLEMICFGATVWCGNVSNDVVAKFKEKSITYYNFLNNEIFACLNAKLTAEGILAEMLLLVKKSLFEQNVLIFGAGRVATAAAILFSKIGIQFSICSYVKDEVEHSYLFSNKCFSPSEIENNIWKYDCIVNTIPAKHITRNIFDKIKPDAVFIETASVCSVDENFVKNFKYSFASGLPKKYIPRSAGKLMFEILMGAKYV